MKWMTVCVRHLEWFDFELSSVWSNACGVCDTDLSAVWNTWWKSFFSIFLIHLWNLPWLLGRWNVQNKIFIVIWSGCIQDSDLFLYVFIIMCIFIFFIRYPRWDSSLNCLCLGHYSKLFTKSTTSAAKIQNGWHLFSTSLNSIWAKLMQWAITQTKQSNVIKYEGKQQQPNINCKQAAYGRINLYPPHFCEFTHVTLSY